MINRKYPQGTTKGLVSTQRANISNAYENQWENV